MTHSTNYVVDYGWLPTEVIQERMLYMILCDPWIRKYGFYKACEMYKIQLSD